eukprot:1771039-Pyramimonas_sp.AAC.1
MVDSSRSANPSLVPSPEYLFDIILCASRISVDRRSIPCRTSLRWGGFFLVLGGSGDTAPASRAPSLGESESEEEGDGGSALASAP